jgi:hypothetical protein
MGKLFAQNMGKPRRTGKAVLLAKRPLFGSLNHGLFVMHLSSMNFEAVQRFKEARRKEDEDKIASGAATPEAIQEKNSWFARPNRKKILNAQDVGLRMADTL